MATDDFLYPLVYTGNKPEKNVQMLLGSLVPVIFKLGPLSEQEGPLYGQRYADVTEKQGRLLVKRLPEQFRWPEGIKLGPQLVTREEHDALADRLAALEAMLRPLPSDPDAPGPLPTGATVKRAGGRPRKEASDAPD